MTTLSSPTISYKDDESKEMHPLTPPSPAMTISNTHSASNSPTCSKPASSLLSCQQDDVTTIFVVGFPDDMLEREFRNMFIFSKGFEAASLKWHCKDQQDDQDLFYGILNNHQNKKQMIGFARFHSPKQAQDAALEMNGKRVDVEKGSILKAEMAKKNMHIKRHYNIDPSATSSIPLASVLFPELSSSPMSRIGQPQTDLFSTAQSSATGAGASYEPFSPLPRDLLSPGDYQDDPFLLEPPNNTPSFSESLFGPRSHSFDGPSAMNRSCNTDMTQQPFNFYSKLDADPFSYLSKSTHVPNYDFAFLMNNTFFGEDLSAVHRKNSLMQPSLNIERSASALAISLRSPSHATDQNPPCNTLYVGNLPPATSEDELRSLFSPCEGYKRMCFRQKPQGPMCFVEFDNVVYATQAMSQHQGYALSNSCKGGVRLSFSKNPLFIKPNKESISSNIAFSFKQMGTALLADL